MQSIDETSRGCLGDTRALKIDSRTRHLLPEGSLLGLRPAFLQEQNGCSALIG